MYFSILSGDHRWLHTLKIRVSKKKVIRGMHRTGQYSSLLLTLRLTRVSTANRLYEASRKKMLSRLNETVKHH